MPWHSPTLPKQDQQHQLIKEILERAFLPSAHGCLLHLYICLKSPGFLSLLHLLAWPSCQDLHLACLTVFHSHSNRIVLSFRLNLLVMVCWVFYISFPAFSFSRRMWNNSLWSLIYHRSWVYPIQSNTTLWQTAQNCCFGWRSYWFSSKFLGGGERWLSWVIVEWEVGSCGHALHFTQWIVNNMVWLKLFKDKSSCIMNPRWSVQGMEGRRVTESFLVMIQAEWYFSEWGISGRDGAKQSDGSIFGRGVLQHILMCHHMPLFCILLMR